MISKIRKYTKAITLAVLIYFGLFYLMNYTIKPTHLVVAWLAPLVLMLPVYVYYFKLKKAKDIHKKIKITFAFIFLLIICAPFINEQFNIFPNSEENLEKRAREKKPEFSFTKEYSTKFETYYNDNFGFREHLIQWASVVKATIFNTSINPQITMFGENGWLFFNNIKDPIFTSYTHTNLYTREELDFVTNLWETRKKKCNDAGIQYIMSFWPNKETVYADSLPYVMKIQIKDTVSKADQIINHLKERKSPFQIVDIRGALLKARKNNQVYPKFDTHWNNYGAFIAYESFFKQTQYAIGQEPHKLEDFDIKWVNNQKGDLVNMIGLSEIAYIDKEPIFTRKDKNTDVSFKYYHTDTDEYPMLTTVSKNNSCNNQTKVLIFRDSFTTKLEPFFSSHFFEVIYIWSYYKQDIVDSVKPDIIIDAHVERNL